MQDAKLIQRFILECAPSGARAKQGLCVLSHNSTDALDFFPRLRQVMKGVERKLVFPYAIMGWGVRQDSSPAIARESRHQK